MPIKNLEKTSTGKYIRVQKQLYLILKEDSNIDRITKDPITKDYKNPVIIERNNNLTVRTIHSINPAPKQDIRPINTQARDLLKVKLLNYGIDSAISFMRKFDTETFNSIGNNLLTQVGRCPDKKKTLNHLPPFRKHSYANN